ncbi:MAG: hypothetical protein Q4A01_05605 [Coriobacteriales bacterium]|nr:hypothetical protein [Coriobacteriales bacterium]
MTWYYADERETTDAVVRNAGGKARADVNAILARMGMSPLAIDTIAGRDQAGKIQKLAMHRTTANNWLQAIRTLSTGDGLVVQMPPVGHTIFFGRVMRQLAKKHVRLILLVHDLDTLRLALREDASRAEKSRIRWEESSAFSYASAVIVHNDRMARALHTALDYPMDRIVSLELFDYLIPGPEPLPNTPATADSVVIAGNLDPQKTGYLYSLPHDVRFDLFGLGFNEELATSNVVYEGSFEADAPPVQRFGRYGLVWDGPSAATCDGAYGQYLRINNPHKTSLYLACQRPVIVWDEAAIADVIREYHVGLCVGSLNELKDALDAVSADDYEQMRANACELGAKLRDGYFTQRAVAAALDLASS